MNRSKRISLLCCSLLSVALAAEQASAAQPPGETPAPISKKNRRFRLTASTKDTPVPTTPAPATPAPDAAIPAPTAAPSPLPADATNPDPTVLLPPPGTIPPPATPNPAKVALQQKPLPPIPSKTDASREASVIESSITTNRIGLLDAVRMTLLKNTSIKLSAEDVAQARAQLRIATGQFDFKLTGSLGWSRTQQELPDSQKQSVYNSYGQMQVQRDALKTGVALQQKNFALLSAGQQPLPDTSTIADPNLRASADLQNLISQQTQSLANQLLASVATPDQQAQINKLQTEAQQDAVNTAKITLGATEKSLKALQNQLAKFPPITVQVQETAQYSMQLVKQLRNGVSLGVFTDFTGTDDNFTRRLDTPNTDSGNTNTTHVGVVLNIPFGQGSGAAASAQERSSAVTVEANRLNLQHSISTSVLQTVQSYWNIVAAQQRLRLLLRSELINGALVNLSHELIKADEIPASDISQIEAQYANAQAQRISAEQDLVTAIQGLAVSMGLDLNALVFAPMASDGFPDEIALGTLKAAPRQAFATTALWNRSDRLAALKAEQAGRILIEAAKINLRPNVGLQVKTSYASVVQGSHWENYIQSYEREHGPSVSAALSLAWPLENNAAIGNLEATSSVYNQTTLQTDSLSRNIISSVVVDLSGLQRSKEAIEKSRLASAEFEKAYQSELEKLKLGNSTLIDAIQTEQFLTSSQLQLVASRLNYALALAQLRFDTGTLLPREKEMTITKQDIVTLPPVNGISINPPGTNPLVVPAKAKPSKR